MARSFQQGDEPVAGYKLTRFLGRGGFGEVWQADAPGGTEVAFKIIDLGEKSGLKEFRSIQRVKRVRHPNLVPIIALWLRDENGKLVEEMTSEQQLNDSSYKPAELFIAMGLGDKSLHDRFKESKEQGLQGIPGLELISYVEDAARAIDHLNSPKHDLGQGPVSIQHCDIKPQNILIVGDAAQVCDFGLARVLGENRSTTNPAVTLAFAAPEILEDSNPSPTTDQYALAMTYYYLRTGTLPFSKVDPSTIIMEALDGKLDFSRVSAAEQLVIKRATGRKPSGRFGTCLDMARELRRALEQTGGAAKAATLVIEPGSEIVAGHKLVRCLGRGAYGEVWEAMAPGRIPVALKIIRDLDRAGGRGKQEFKALEVIQRVTHNHLMELRAYWLLDRQGQPIPDELRGTTAAPVPVTLIIATKLADKNLAQVLEEYQARGMPGIPIQELLRYVRQAAESIDYLNAPRHKLGDRRVSIQHRDVKPDNIMLADGIVRLTDFGLAKVVELDEVSAEIHQDSVGFTFHYAAPEVMRGRVTKWSDQYSLAITYYFLRTGQLPFERVGSAYDMMMRQLEGKLDLTLLPESERRVLARAVQVVPEDRYPTCMSFVQAIEATLPASGDVPPLPHKPQPRGQSAWELAMLHSPSGGAMPSTERHPEPLAMPPDLEPLKPFGTSMPPPIPPSPVPVGPAAMAGGISKMPSGMSLYGSLAPMSEAPPISDMGLGLGPLPSDLDMLTDPNAPHASPTSRPYAEKAATSPEPPPLPQDDMYGSIGAANMPGGMSAFGMKPPSPSDTNRTPGFRGNNQRPHTMHADNLLDLYPELQPVFGNSNVGGPMGGSVMESLPKEEEATGAGSLESQHPHSRVDWKGGKGVSAEPRKTNYLLFAGIVMAGMVVVLIVGLMFSRGDRPKETPLASNGSGDKAPTGSTPPTPPQPSPPAASPTGTIPSITFPTIPQDTTPPRPPDENKVAELRRLSLRFSTPQAIDDEAAFHESAKQLLEYDLRHLNTPELLAYRAEYHLEKLDQTPQAQACLNRARGLDPRNPPPGIVHYVEARTLHKLGRKEDAALALSQAPNDLLVGFRQPKALQVYEEAAKERMRTVRIDPGRVEPTAFTAPAWIAQANALSTSVKEEQLPTDLLLLFAWGTPTPKQVHLDALLDRRVAELDRRRDGSLTTANLFRRRAKAREGTNPGAAMGDYQQAYARLKSTDMPVTAQYDAAIAPALAFAESLGPDQFDDAGRAKVAELYATRGQLIYRNPRPAQGNWTLRRDDPYREASSAYEEALRFYPFREDATRAEYHTQHGMCLTKLGKYQLNALDIQDIEKDAAAATRMNPQSAEAFTLKGIGLYYRATLDKTARRAAVTREERQRLAVQKLSESVNAYTRAIELAPSSLPKEDRSNWYANRSQAYSYWAQVLTEEKGREAEARTKFDAAIKDATQAVELQGDNVNAHAARGIAHQLFAMHLRTGPDAEDHWKKAEAAFQVQVSQRQNRALGHINMGQLYVYQFLTSSQNSMLERAKEEFDNALKLDGANPDANFWMGFIAHRQDQPDKAAEHFFKAVQDPKYMRFNVDRINANIPDDKALEPILFAGVIDKLAPRPSELAPWNIMRASFRISQVYKRITDQKEEKKKLELADVPTLEQCIAHADQATGDKVFNVAVKGMGLEIAAEGRLLAAIVKEAPVEKRLRWVDETRDRLKQLTKETSPDLSSRWASMAEVCFSLALERQFSVDQRRKLLNQAEEASKEAEKLTTDTKVQEQMRQFRNELNNVRRDLQ